MDAERGSAHEAEERLLLQLDGFNEIGGPVQDRWHCLVVDLVETILNITQKG
jgi:hypothetical protein